MIANVVKSSRIKWYSWADVEFSSPRLNSYYLCACKYEKFQLFCWILCRYIDPLPVHHWEGVEVDEYKRQLQGVPNEHTFKLGWRCSLILFYRRLLYLSSICLLIKVIIYKHMLKTKHDYYFFFSFFLCGGIG